MSPAEAGRDHGRFRFRRSGRLLSAKDYSAVFDNNDFRASQKQLLVLARRSVTAQSRLGMVIGKKHVRLAVARHRIKRIMREQFRQHRDLFSGLDVVFVARQGLGSLSGQEIAGMVNALAASLCKQCARERGA